MCRSMWLIMFICTDVVFLTQFAVCKDCALSQFEGDLTFLPAFTHSPGVTGSDLGLQKHSIRFFLHFLIT